MLQKWLEETPDQEQWSAVSQIKDKGIDSQEVALALEGLSEDMEAYCAAKRRATQDWLDVVVGCEDVLATQASTGNRGTCVDGPA